MDIRKKAFGVGGSAVLLASLLASIAAPAALAGSVTIIAGGAINPGGPASTAITISGAEGAVAEWSDGATTITLTDSAGGSTITWSGSPTVTASGGPAPFACSAGTAGAVLTLTCSGTTITRLDSFSITGLKVKAAYGAALGNVIASWSGPIALGSTTGTATGTLDNDEAASLGGTREYTLNAGSPDFENTSVNSNKITVGAMGLGSASEAVTATGLPSSPFTADFIWDHDLGATLTQTVSVNRLPTLATVGDVTTVSGECFSAGLDKVKQGVNNQDNYCEVKLDVGRAGYVATGATITYTITTPGVLFSGVPAISNNGGGDTIAVGGGVLSLDRKSVTYTVSAKSTTDNDYVWLYDFSLDVAQSAVAGAVVNVNVTVSGASTIGNPAAIAQVQGIIVGVGSVPTVLIGYNDQNTGLVTITENVAGALSDEIGGTANIIRICEWWSSESMIRQPWAVVTKGDMKLNSGGLPVTQVKMVLDPSGRCASALIWQQSTVASTIEIHRGVDAASSAPLMTGTDLGPAISVASWATPGPVAVQVVLDSGVAADLDDGWDGSDLGPPVINAMRAYSGSPLVKALSQPIITAGGVNQLAGGVTIEETFAGQFATGDYYELCLVPRSSTEQQDVFFSTSYLETTSPSTSNQPLVTTNNETGLVVSFYGFDPDTSEAGDGIGLDCLQVYVDAEPVVGLGKITINNIRYDVTPDAPNGAVQLNVAEEETGSGVAPGSHFNQTISNATVGARASASISRGSVLGLTHIGTFTTATKVQGTGKYITWRFVGGAAIAGKLVHIQVATRGASSWSTFTTLTSRVADSAGRVFFHWRSSSPAWISVRAFFPGDAAINPAYSGGAQGRWR